ncbi:hypothetical protein [Chryseosolibacter indicus]|uniref:Uncharacterized protein n=1 Tax=Chryseosolibacter indicus TaxID=2782351 RepID=A0ABS5VQ23_9BACT|nr:hypothetical protein [Chryseosolibacter indicus]MBT1703528.1 hypothetical protein [Chryseosolibacter indicus]
MALSEHLETKLKKRYEPSSMVSMKYKGNDLAFKTDDEGNAILLFIGKKDSEGHIKGERYARRLKKDDEGKVIKDHWELKGKAT